jgi:dTDP-4-amino-4,6-dideoxygalactose transaminase
MTPPRSIPYFNYPAMFASIEKEVTPIVMDVLKRGAFIMQKDLFEFETHLAEFLGVKHAIGVADGSVAIIMALRGAGIAAGDEVILPSHTFVATAAAVHHIGATPILAECGADHIIDPESVKSLVTDKTRAILPVQLNGRTADMDALQAIADEYGLTIVEDAAQALGSKYKGKGAGTFGAAGTFSFYPAKLLGCFGDGGAVVTDDDTIAARVRAMRDHGRDDSGEVSVWGYNARLDNLQAAVLDFQLQERFKDYVSRRREVAQKYQDSLGKIADLILPPPPNADGDRFDVYQNYEIESSYRDGLREHLRNAGIGTLIQWGGKAIHQFSKLGFTTNLPFTTKVFDRCLMLPMNVFVSNDDVDYICEVIHDFYQTK